MTTATHHEAPPTRILAVSGSLQARSSNTALVRMAQHLANDQLSIDVFGGLDSLPYFNPDLDIEPPPAVVADLRARVAAADAVLIASPEYAHEMPGVLKNALEWLVSSGELYAKPVAVLCAAPGPQRGAYAREALERTLCAEGAQIILSTTVVVAPGQSAIDGPPEAIHTVSSALAALSVASSRRRAAALT